MSQDYNMSPINPLPPVVWLLALPIIAMEIVLTLAQRGLMGGAEGIGWRLDAVQRFAFSPELMRGMIEASTYPAEQVMRLVTYPFVHGGMTHAIFVIVFLLALGKMVGEIFRWWAVLVVFFGSAIAAALAYTVLPFIQLPLIGGYPAVYGLIGAYSYILWMQLAGVGANRYAAFRLIGALMAIQLIFGAVFGANWNWLGELAGFFAGFFLSFLVSPGGWARLRARLRER